MIAIAIATGQNSAGLDPAASAFIQATGITGELQKAAINNLVLNLKKYNIWSKMKAVYPFVTDNRNILSYTEDFGNAFWAKTNLSVTDNSTTAPNGTSTADTITANGVSGVHSILASSTLSSTTTHSFSVFFKKGTNDFIQVGGGGVLFGTEVWANFNLNTGTIGNQGTLTTSQIESFGNGWYRCTIVGTTISAGTGTGMFVQLVTSGTSVRGESNSLSTSVFMWGAQLELGSTATTYQPIATTQQAYIASQFKYNLVNPVDSDAAFRLVFNGGWTHSSNGALPNGTNGYADTKLVPSSVFSSNADNAGISVYQTNPPIGQNNGAFDSTTRFFGQLTSLAFDARLNTQHTVIYTIPYVSDGKGLVTTTRNGTNNTRAYKNGVFISEVAVNTGLTPFSSFVGARNGTGTADNYDNTIQKFLSYHNGLTDDDATNLYYSTQVFQTTLGRQVGSPAYALPAVNDVNAKLYLSAINSSDPTVNGAVDTFISGLKTDGIYSKMKAVYPFVTDQRNLASYTEDFSNAGWTKTQTNIIANATTSPDGTTTADKLVENTTNNNHNVFQQIIMPNVAMTFSIYAKKSERSYCYVNISDLTSGDASIKVDLNNGTLSPTGIAVGSWTNISSSISDVGNGWYRISISATKGAGTIAQPYIVLLNNSQATPYLGDGSSGIFLWGAQLELGSTATTYQPIATTQQAYIANQFKYNMINPQDDDSAFRLVFNGGWTHSPQGATPNGVNGYADTKLNPSLAMTLNSTSMSVYSRTNNALDIVDFGVSDVAVNRMLMAIKWSNNDSYYDMYNNTTNRITYTMGSSSSSGLFITNRSNNVVFNIWKNNTKLTTNTNTQLVNLPNKILFIGANNSTVIENYSTRQYAFAHIGNGLTDTEAANLYTRVQAYQTLLNRQIP